MAERVTIKVSGVAPGTTEERIKAFFEEKGEDISVEILSSLEDDAVVVELIGVTETELEILLTGSYKLSKRPIQLEIVSPDESVDEIESDGDSTLIEVHGASCFEQDDLEVYFETPKAGGRKGSIKSCTIEPNGIARIEFENPEDVASVMSITNHCLFGTPLKLTYPSSPGQQASSRIWLTEVPQNLVNEIECLTRLLERIVGDEFPFSLTQINDATLLLEFSEEVQLSEKELQQIAEGIRQKQVKGVKLKPTLTMPTSSPIVTMEDTNSKLLVSTLEDTDIDHLTLLLEKAMNMDSDTDFSVSFVENCSYLVTFERNLSEKEADYMIKRIERFPKMQIKAKLFNDHCCQLMLSNLPRIRIAHLELFLEKVIGEEKEFILKELENRKALLEFKRSMPDEELAKVVAAITSTEVKGAYLKVKKLELPYTEVPFNTSSPEEFYTAPKARSAAPKPKSKLLIANPTKEVKGVRRKVEVWKDEANTTSTVLLVSNVPSNCTHDHEFLGAELEKSLEMELDENFFLSAHGDSSVLVTFKKSLSSQDLDEVIEKINETDINDRKLKATVFNVQEMATSSEEVSYLLLEDIPENVDEDYIETIMSGATNREVSVKFQEKCTALLTFEEELPDSELKDMMYKIKTKRVKGKSLKVTSWKPTHCVWISSISEHYDEDYLKNYLENTKRSGGGEVESIELFGNGIAKVIFKKLKAMRNVIQRQHAKSLGDDVTVVQDNPLDKSEGSAPEPTLQDLQIKVLPEIVGVLQHEQTNWSSLLGDLHVNVSVDVHQAVMTITPSKYTPAGWMKCESNVRKYIDDNFATKDLPVSQVAAFDVMKLLQSRRNDISYSVSEDSTVLHLVGNPNLLSQIENQVHEIIASVKIIDKLLTLDPEDFAFISQIKHQEISELFPDVKIVFTAPNSLSLNGAARDVKKLENSVTNLSVHSSLVMEMDPLLKLFASTNDGRDQIRNYINTSHGINAAICVNGKDSASCTVVALFDCKIMDDAKNAVCNAQKELCIGKLIISAKCQAKLSEHKNSSDYLDICEQLQKKHGVLVKCAFDCICIAGFKDKVSQTHSALNEFIQTKCKVTRTVKIEYGMWLLFQTYMESEWKTLVMGNEHDVTPGLEKNSVISINICGQVDKVDESCEELILLQKKISIKDVYLPSYATSFSDYEKSSDWTFFCSGVENSNKVIIATLNSEEFTESDAVVAEDKNSTKMSNGENISTSLKSMPLPQSMVRISSKLECVTIYKGSILDIKADVYVNSTNVNLDLKGGAVSDILAASAGPSLQDECTRQAPIKPGQIAVTGGGNIKCKYIFHVALNTYDGPGGIAEKVLKESMDNCLNECRKQNVTSIAFPALGTGHIQFPPQVAARIMMESIVALRDLTRMRIHIIIFKNPIQKAFEEMKTSFEGTASNTVAAKEAVFQLSIHQPQICKQKSRKGNAGSYKSSLNTMLSSNNFSFDNVTVSIVHGDLADHNSDAIVNSASSDMKYDSGASGSILKKGGLELTKACEAYIAQRNQLDIGNVAITPACGGLKCKTVFHVNVDPKQLQLAVSTCLKAADSLKYQTISFPALATGGHQSSADDVATEMYMAFHQYALQKPQHTTQISVVIFKRELLDPFLKAFQQPAAIVQPYMYDGSSSDDGDLPLDEEVLPHEVFPSDDEYLPSHDEFLPSDDKVLPSDKFISSNCINPSVSNPDDITSFWFRIYGADHKNVRTAATVLDEHLSKTFVVECIDNILAEPSEDIRRLCNIENVTLSHNAKANVITLTGQKRGVDIVRRKIEGDKFEQEKRINFKREAELIYKQIQWQHQMSDKSYVPYSVEVNALIEKAYLEKEKVYNHNDSTDPFSIDFGTNIEIKPNSMSKMSKVKREDLLALYRGDAQKNWEEMPRDPKTKTELMCYLVDLKNTSQEFVEVQQRFALTLKAQTIINIQRVQNTVLYGQYIARKNAMEKLNPPGTTIENLLFHGTSEDTIPKINSQGFNRTFAGKNATLYGRGVYFAVNASYSANAIYSPPDANGRKYMYLARVLTGEFTAGNSSMIVPPAKNPSIDPNILFDSVVDNLHNPTMYIIFQDAQAYPEYLITFVV